MGVKKEKEELNRKYDDSVGDNYGGEGEWRFKQLNFNFLSSFSSLLKHYRLLAPFTLYRETI